MADAASSLLLSAACKVYGALLYLYPEAHRLAYGPRMAQLFRDLCRDAHQQGGALGLTWLWLWTCFDLVTTAVREHLETGGTAMEDILRTQGLVPALASYANELAGAKHFRVHLGVEGSVPRLHDEAESLVFGIVQEAVANAKKHAQADNLWITVHCQEDTLSVSVRDDGRGFESKGAVPVASETDIGKRAQLIQGKLSIQSAVGEGSSIELTAPLTPNLAKGTS
jgi:signal transduction histidine kinase